MKKFAYFVVMTAVLALSVYGGIHWCINYESQPTLNSGIMVNGKCKNGLHPYDGWCMKERPQEDPKNWSPVLWMGLENCLFGDKTIHDSPWLKEPCEIMCPMGGVVLMAGAPRPKEISNIWIADICAQAYTADKKDTGISIIHNTINISPKRP